MSADAKPQSQATPPARPLLVQKEHLQSRSRWLKHLSENASVFAYISSIVCFLIGIAYLRMEPLTQGLTETQIAYNAATVQTNGLIWTFAALLVGLVADRIATTANLRRSEVEHGLALAEITNAIAAETIQRVGSGNEVLIHLNESIKKASYVRNTFLNVGGAHGHDEEERISQMYVDFLTRANAEVWQDIISANELFEFRHTTLSIDKPKAKHSIAVLRHSMPIINFVLLENRATNFHEVYFGWIFDTNRTSTMIYKSTHPDVIDVFEKYFAVLWRDQKAEEWIVPYEKQDKNDRGPGKYFAVDKRGVWVTAALDTREKGGICKVLSYAVLRIEFEPRQPTIRGAIYPTSGSNRRILHQDITESPNRLFVEYQDAVDGEIHRGYCVYKFERDGTKDIIRGDLAQTHGRQNNMPRIVFGLKFDGEKTANDAEILDAMRDKVDELWREELGCPKAVVGQPQASPATGAS
jgi:hypothetical protein